MDIKKVQVTAFAIRNRLLGYRLLQNPKGESPYKIKMMKTWSGISTALDEFNHYYTKSKDFSKPNSKAERQYLLVARLMFWKSKNEKKVIKEVSYLKTKSNGEFISKTKNDRYSLDEYVNRDTSYIDKEHRTGYHKELIPFLFIPVEHKVPTIESIADREISRFFNKKNEKEAHRKNKSFWTVLKCNLTNKEVS